MTSKLAKLGPENDFTAFIYIYIYIYMLWSYYLGHAWGFLMVINWATFVFLKTLFVKNTIKIGVSADLFSKKEGTRIF